MTTPYAIEEADLCASSASIESLWVANLRGHSSSTAQAKLRLGYRDNPAGKGAALLLRAGDGDAKGIQGLHPRRFHFRDRSLRAAGLADYAVDAQHRSLGPALMLMRRGTQLGSERFDLVYGLPNAKAAAVCARAGMKRLGAMRRYAKPLATLDRLSTRMPTGLARCCAPLVDRGLGLIDAVRRLRVTPRLSCRSADWTDAAFDALWARRQPALLLSERSGAMLRWRYGLPERGDWRVCLAEDDGGRVCGYVVWRLSEGFAEIGDFFTPDPQVFTAPLMLAFAGFARRAGAGSVSVEFFGCPGVAGQLLRAGMRLRPQESPVFKVPGQIAELDSPHCWYLTGFDNDAD